MLNDLKIVVSGKYAMFTRPEFKTERVSYDVPPPGALEGLLKSIYWKPSMRYVIDNIVVFNPINFINIRTNEVNSKLSFSKVKTAIKTGSDPSLYRSDICTQRASRMLKDVKYGIEFHIKLTGIQNEKGHETIEKQLKIFTRRVLQGQCFRTPCFGITELPVEKIELVDDFDLSEIHPSVLQTKDQDLGYMLYRIQFRDENNADAWKTHTFSDIADGIYYRPHMKNGIINVESYRQDTII